MSNIYIQEPPTNGKVLLTTTVGDIDIELWSKEAPKACRNFVQLCMEGYYDNTIFHRVVKDFIVQGGDPTGTGTGGDSIYGKPFKDEFHSRLRFVRRGLIAMANAGSHDNGSQFFFTLAATPELQNKHTIFGKVSGNTVYNMIKLGECDVDHTEKPLHPYKVNKTKVLSNPFEDIIPRVLPKREVKEDAKKKSKSKATKNFNLLSFGEEAEEDEVETNEATKAMKVKSKSSHDLIDDPKLSSVAISQRDDEPGKELEGSDNGKSESDVPESNEVSKHHKRKRGQDDDSQGHSDKSHASQSDSDAAEKIRKKLKKEPVEDPSAESEDDAKKPKSRSDELRKEVLQLKREIKEAMKRKEQREKGSDGKDREERKEEDETAGDDVVAKFKMERKKYKDLKRHQPKKGSEREQQTLALLAKFQTKLHTSQQMSQYNDDEEEEGGDADNDNEKDETADDNDYSWISHKMKCEDNSGKVLDANVTDVDRYEIYDPRNPMNQRRREASKQALKAKR